MDKKKKEDAHKEHYASKEQGILDKETSDEITMGMRTGEHEEDVYSKEGRDQLEADDEIEPWEQGFMEGAEGTGKLGEDALTGEPLMDVEDVVEMEINGQTYRFVSEENARKFREKKELEEE